MFKKTGIIKMIKTLKNTAFIAAILSASTVANANTMGMKNFHVGFDVMGTTLDWQAAKGKDLFPRNPMNFGAFVAGDYYTCNKFSAGLELGAEYMQKTKGIQTQAGQTGNDGGVIIATEAPHFKNKLTATTPYLGLTGGYELNKQFKLIGMVGAGLYIGKMSQHMDSLTDQTNNTTVAKDNTINFNKTAFMPIVRVGAQYDLNDTVGIRANVSYRYMKNFNQTGSFAGSPLKSSLQAKNSVFAYGAGLVFSF
jgi:hypothetical protein